MMRIRILDPPEVRNIAGDLASTELSICIESSPTCGGSIEKKNQVGRATAVGIE